MILKVQSANVLKGTVRLPASKSYSIRAFIIAACGGKSQIIHPSDCDDAKVAKSIAQYLGAQVRTGENNTFLIEAQKIAEKLDRINVHESGTVLRLLLTLLALRGKSATVIGEGTLVGRPNRHLLDALRARGVAIAGTGPKESVPIRLQPEHPGQILQSGVIEIDGSVSSQFISSLLIACPQLSEKTTLKIIGSSLVSADYIEMTTAVLKAAGIKIEKVSPRKYLIPGQQKFNGLKNFKVPSDYGLAAFLMAAAAILPSDVTFKGYFDDNYIQADGRILEFLQTLGVRFKRTRDTIRMKGPFVLKGGIFSLKDCPDLVPIMAVLGLFATGVTRLVDIGHARVKESDRISDLRLELLKLGARVEEKSDELIVYPLSNFRSRAILDPHHDHRLAMAFTVLGLRAGLKVRDIECTKKSYPQFVKDMKSLQAPLVVA